ncbi:O-antigen ligase family protein [Vibrio hepatarius]|uniref:O-antigen ligase family protein n=1 Tax=Vibrio hepatarius TaxID=171383 RepID=UPI00148BF59D|nr:O-antigen ligase family protein [Vibrio hepatarius]NOI15122.1 O-antigen ligase family protein [Vibrio hepatarius]
MKDRITYLITFLPFLWVFSGLLAYDSDKHYVVICITSFVLSIKYLEIKNIVTTLNHNKFIYIILLAAILAILTKILVGQSSSILRILIATSLICLTLNNKNLSKIKVNLWWLSSVGSFTSLTYIAFNKYTLDLVRTDWSINPIPYTTMVASLSTISLYYLLFSAKRKIQIISLLSYISGISGIMLSETRGTLLALACASILLLLSFLYHCNCKKKIFSLILLLLFFISSTAYLNSDIIESRIEKTQYELTQISNGNYSTSIGLRLSMWKAGLELAKNPTLIGLGDAHIELKQRLADEGKIPQNVVKWPHYHNDYISSLVKRGVLGFIMLITLLSFPVYCYFKNKSEYTFIALGISTVYAVCSITDIPLFQAGPLIMYLVIMIILCSNSYPNEIKT